MAKRLVEVVLAALAAVVAGPLVALAARGIRLSSAGPVLYRAERVGRDRRPFIMFRVRAMPLRRRSDSSRITGARDPRVVPFGAWLRAVKVDDLPQLWNVLRGEMALVGPRPEDPAIVARHYDALGRETLTVRPGLASPGSIYSSTHGAALLVGPDPEAAYAARLLPVKLALDVVYVRPFIMFKLRTMHLRRRSHSSRITGARDPRVYRAQLEHDERPPSAWVVTGGRQADADGGQGDERRGH